MGSTAEARPCDGHHDECIPRYESHKSLEASQAATHIRYAAFSASIGNWVIGHCLLLA